MTAGHNNLNRPETPWTRLQRQSRRIIFAALVLSGLFHLLSYVRLSGYHREGRHLLTQQQQQRPVNIRIVQKPETKKTEPVASKILETPQQETAKPKDAQYVGNENHSTDKETKVEFKPRQKALDPGQQGNPQATQQPSAQQPKQVQSEKSKTEISKGGKVAIVSRDEKEKARNAYESLLPSAMNDLYGQVNAGYQDYIDDDLAIGDRIDINTSEYRFIGYFTNMRKAIELVWNYPLEASQRGMQGEVGLEFAINKDGSAGKIKVLKSSGYEVLDRAIVNAIKDASPFSPLPNGFGKNRIVVTGSFRYVLSAYGSH